MRSTAMFTALLLSILPSEISAKSPKPVPQWEIFEGSFERDLKLSNPFANVDMNVIYTAPDGSERRFLGFYQGDNT